MLAAVKRWSNEETLKNYHQYWESIPQSRFSCTACFVTYLKLTAVLNIIQIEDEMKNCRCY